MALELLAGPFDCVPVVDRVRVTTGQPATGNPGDTIGGYTMLIEGRGILTQFGRVRTLVQPDGAFARLGFGRFAMLGQSNVLGLAWVDGLRQSYVEYEQYVSGSAISTRRAHELHPVTLAGWRDVGPEPPNRPYNAAMVRDGSWISTAFGLTAVHRHNGASWIQEATLPIVRGTYLSWSDDPDEVWIANQEGDAVRYNWVVRAAVGSVVRTHVANFGMFYWRKHGVFVSIHSEAGIRRTRVWATTPRPHSLMQTVLPAPTAGRVSRIATRVVGSDGEPCAGEVVRWTVPDGYQLVPLSPVTNVDGYAFADLIVPMGATGTAEVSAEAVV